MEKELLPQPLPDPSPPSSSFASPPATAWDERSLGLGSWHQGCSSFDFGWSRERAAKPHAARGISGCPSRQSSEELPCCHFPALGVVSAALGILHPGPVESFRKLFHIDVALRPPPHRSLSLKGFTGWRNKAAFPTCLWKRPKDTGGRGWRPSGFPSSSPESLNHADDEGILASALHWVRKHSAM